MFAVRDHADARGSIEFIKADDARLLREEDFAQTEALLWDLREQVLDHLIPNVILRFKLQRSSQTARNVFNLRYNVVGSALGKESKQDEHAAAHDQAGYDDNKKRNHLVLADRVFFIHLRHIPLVWRVRERYPDVYACAFNKLQQPEFYR